MCQSSSLRAVGQLRERVVWLARNEIKITVVCFVERRRQRSFVPTPQMSPPIITAYLCFRSVYFSRKKPCVLFWLLRKCLCLSGATVYTNYFPSHLKYRYSTQTHASVSPPKFDLLPRSRLLTDLRAHASNAIVRKRKPCPSEDPTNSTTCVGVSPQNTLHKRCYALKFW